MSIRKLTGDEIEKLASRAKVKRNAVENFLTSLTGDASADGYNATRDARSYKWNAPTLKAINDGIRLAYGGR